MRYLVGIAERTTVVDPYGTLVSNTAHTAMAIWFTDLLHEMR
jgi:hypothetical protein